MRMYFLDSTDGEKYEYNQHGFARFHNQIIGSGVSDVNSLEVNAKTNMDVSIGSGWIFSNGFSLELEESETVTHDISDPTNDRIDRVIIRFDTNPEERRFYPVILKGTPASSPVPPSLTRDNYIQEMSLAQVRIIAGKSFIEQSQITDERADDNVCGYIPLHNIYRGLNINELGMVTMPNQSYVQAAASYEMDISDSSTHNIPIGKMIQVDKQEEVQGDTFVAKADGVYLIFAYVGFSEGELSSGFDVQLSLRVNGAYSTAIVARAPSSGKDNIFSGNTVEELKAGDVIELTVEVRYLNKTVTTRNFRARIAKIS